MNNSQTSSWPTLSALTILLALSCLAAPGIATGDIYSFVTVDGVETFTDSPSNKQAKIVIKEISRKSSKNRKSIKPEKIHTISLNEIVEKTIQGSNTQIPVSTGLDFSPRLPPVGGVITSGVGTRVDPIDKRMRHHNGIDIAIREGTPVLPAESGVVVYSGLRNGYGYTVLIEHANGMVTLYGHNSRLMVSSGQLVDKDTVVALSGNTGRSTGPHLHFEAWQAGVNVTPAFMPGSTMQISKTRVASHKTTPTFRKQILADGSILFTNMPSSAR